MPGATIIIVPSSESYAESFQRCLDSVARERRHLAYVEAPPIDGLRAFVRMIVESGFVQLLALDGDQVVGWCDVLPKALPGFTHVGALGMGVSATHRRRGIGEQLVRTAISKSWENGLERIELEVFASNLPAIRLYEKLDFLHEGVKRNARKLDGEYDDIILMALQLSPQRRAI